MIQVDNQTKEKRLIYHVKGKSKGSTIVFFAGIHGNEQAGVEALKKVLPSIKEDTISGDIYGVYGNINAIRQNKRYLNNDLNRMWTKTHIDALKHKSEYTSEEKEQLSIYNFINTLLSNTSTPVYFIDFHTTSSKTLPFVTINDALINRKFSKHFPVPVVLGIEEYLEGPLLSYLNKLGYVSLGFEAGQHSDKASIENFESFIHLSCYCSGIYKEQPKDFIRHHNTLKKAALNNRKVYEVIYKYHINNGENFQMKNGFKSFQPIKKGTHLATSDEKPVFAQSSHELFMPLYQNKGNDGFFIIKPIPNYILELSARLRNLKGDCLLTFLPGIKWHDKDSGVLQVNVKIARFMAKPIFHLLGYRNKQKDDTHFLLYNRERVSNKIMYEDLPWYKIKKRHP